MGLIASHGTLVVRQPKDKAWMCSSITDRKKGGDGEGQGSVREVGVR